jgi:hypothetical protein
MSYQNDLNRMGSIGGSACFCSGRCRQLGYCPNQQGQAIGMDWQKYFAGQQGNAQRTPVREMTAGDLGLRCSCDRIDCAQCSKTFHKSFVGPYAFWLGAEG